MCELDLACNSIGPDGAKALAKALDGLEELDLGNNGIGDGGIKWLAKALKENTTLRKLIVSGNNVTAEGTFGSRNHCQRTKTSGIWTWDRTKSGTWGLRTSQKIYEITPAFTL